MTSTLACPKCGGSGGGPDPALRCPCCHGTGRSHQPMLFVGSSQQDEGEPDTFDGTIWALPTAKDHSDEMGGGPEADVCLIASGIRDEGDAKRLVDGWNSLDNLTALRVQIEQRDALIDELADALREILRESADGVFAPGYRSVRQAQAALEKVRKQ